MKMKIYVDLIVTLIVKRINVTLPELATIVNLNICQLEKGKHVKKLITVTTVNLSVTITIVRLVVRDIRKRKIN